MSERFQPTIRAGIDIRFGTLAVEMGLVDAAALQRAIVDFHRRLAGPERISLGQVLVEAGALTPEGFDRVLAAQGRSLLVCGDPGCGRRYHLSGARTDRTYRCRSCGGFLEFAPDEAASAPPSGDERSSLGRFLDPVEIGRGGMGLVVRAIDPELRRPVALKLLGPGRDSEEAIARFRYEAQIAGQLEHPNIVPVYELGRFPDGAPYLAMKLVEGRTLDEVLRRRLPLAHLLSDFLKVLDAVAFAHSRGVVHRDLKPGNVMIGAFGEVQVMDWGVARVLGKDDSRAPSVTIQREAGTGPLQTLDGQIVGTPAYMPPEQADGRVAQIDRRSDVYSLGAILYAVLAGTAPFSGDNPWKVLKDVGEGRLVPPSRRAGEAGVPRELEAVVLKAMARDPAERYQRVEDLISDVECYLAGRTLGAARYNPVQRLGKWVARHRAASAAAALVLVAAAGLLAAFEWRARREREERIREAVLEADQAMAGLPSGASGEEALETCLAAASALERALHAAPGDAELRERRRKVGLELGRVALAGGDYTLARRAYLDLADYGTDPAAIEELLATVEAARTGVLRRRAGRLGEILDDLSRGLSRPERDPAAPLLEDYVFEASGFVDPQTVEILGRALEPLVEKARREGSSAIWSEGEEGVARFACRVLGRIGSALPGSVDPLASWAEVVADTDLVVEAGQALCNTRCAEATVAVSAIHDRFGPGSNAWKRIRPWLPRIPEGGGGPVPRTAQEWFQSGYGWSERGDLEKALACFSRAIELDPGHLNAYLGRGRVYQDRREVEAAEREFSRAIELDPDWPGAYLCRGSARLMAGEVDGAIADLRRASDLDPANVEYLSVLARALCREGDVEGAIAACTRALEIDPGSSAALMQRSTFRVLARDYEGAIADCDSIIEAEPYHELAICHRGTVKKLKGDFEGSMADFNQAIERWPARPQAYCGRAETRAERGDLAAALADFDLAIEIDPGVVPAYVGRALVHHRMGDLRRAIEDLTSAIGIDPSYSVAFTDRAECHLALGEYEETVADARRASELEPGSWRAWGFLGGGLFELGRFEESLLAMRRGLEVAPPERRKSFEDAIGEIESRR